MRCALAILSLLGFVALATAQVSPDEALRRLKESERTSDNEELDSLRNENKSLSSEVESLGEQIEKLKEEKQELRQQIVALEARLMVHNPTSRSKLDKLVLAQRPTVTMFHSAPSEYGRANLRGYAKIAKVTGDGSRHRPFGVILQDAAGQTFMPGQSHLIDRVKRGAPVRRMAGLSRS